MLFSTFMFEVSIIGYLTGALYSSIGFLLCYLKSLVGVVDFKFDSLLAF